MINDIDFSYGFIYECPALVNNLYDHYNYDHLAIKLYHNFVLPISNITKDEHIKEYNECVKNNKYINRNCSYLLRTILLYKSHSLFLFFLLKFILLLS